MKGSTRYFRSGDETWKFEGDLQPQRKSPLHQRWIEGDVATLPAFFEKFPHAYEITPAAGEDDLNQTRIEGTIGLW